MSQVRSLLADTQTCKSRFASVLLLFSSQPTHTACLSYTHRHTHTESVWCQSASSLPLTKLQRELACTQAELNEEVLKLEAETRDKDGGGC